MDDRSLADILALRARMERTALRLGWETDPDGEAAVAGRLRLWLLGAVVVWAEIGMWWFGAEGRTRLAVVLAALSMVAVTRGIRRLRMRQLRPYLYHGYAVDMLMMLGDRTDLPIPPREAHANRLVLEALFPGTMSGRLLPDHASAVVAVMHVAPMRTARILHAHLRMMLEAEAIRNRSLAPVLELMREPTRPAPADDARPHGMAATRRQASAAR